MLSNKASCSATVALFMVSAISSAAAARIVFNNLNSRWVETRLKEPDICGVPPIKPDMFDSAENIIGGKEAIPHSWPWMVDMELNSAGVFQHQCGGTILARRWVVTAAHCLFGFTDGKVSSPDRVRVKVGQHDRAKPEPMRITIKAKDIHIHEKYKPNTVENDIALIELDTDIPYNRYIRPICQPTVIVFKPGTKCVATGWGYSGLVSPAVLNGSNGVYQYGDNAIDKLMEVVLPIFSQSDCAKNYNSTGRQIADSMICAGYQQGGKDTCWGDSGGPLMCQEADGVWHLVGITSWGHGCAEPNYPGVYTRVQWYNNWINNIIQ